jgi:hypothetical protein
MSVFIEKVQQAVGKCPVCGRLPTWVNHVPLTAYCWGTADNEHREARKVVPSPLQPYGEVRRTRWVVAKE